MGSIDSFSWQGRRGAVSITFDDGTQTQIERAVPVMNDRNLKGTFYVMPRSVPRDADNWLELLAPWKEVAGRGHEVGNHTLAHFGTSSFNESPQSSGLERCTLKEVEEDVLEAERRLRIGVGEIEHSFCYPCYQAHVGQGLTRQSYVPVIARHFIAARGRGEYARNYPATCDLHYLWSRNVEGMSGPELVGHAARAVAEGSWVILTIHNIADDYLPIHLADFVELCDFLARSHDDIWVAPVVDIAKHILEWRRSNQQH